MAEKGKVLVCEKCGNIVVVAKEGGNPNIDCCGEHMKENVL